MTKFNDNTKEKLKTAIKKGAPYEIACKYANISYEIFRQWRKKANIEKIPDYVAFFEDLKEAEGHTALVWLDKIDKAMADGCWQAAAWKLERRYHKWFSSKAADIDFNERLTALENEGKNKDVCDGEV